MIKNNFINTEREASERENIKTCLSMTKCDIKFAILTSSEKVIEAYFKMKNNYGSDTELKKIL